MRRHIGPGRLLWPLLLAALWLTLRTPAAAQEQCGTATTIDFPIDITTFRLAQDYGVASPRHQGRFHTGEDWFLPSGGLGVHVRAVAAGRVTFSSPNGWGRDGGVIIIEHTFPDGSMLYSQYGHIAPSESVAFPTRYSCVQAGDVIATLGDARPAPHLHLEMRSNQPDTPGPGYTREDPRTLGFLRPSQVILNQRAWLNPFHAWHYLNETYAPPPVLLGDYTALILDGNTLRGVTYDGRVLWRSALEGDPVALHSVDFVPHVIEASGAIARLGDQGIVEERWTLDFQPASPPIRSDLLPDAAPILHTADNALVALTPDLRAIDWRLEGIEPFRAAYYAADLIALVSENGTRLTLVSAAGERVGQSELRDGAGLTAAPDGSLIVHTYGGLWSIDAGGEWSELLADAPPGGGSGAVAMAGDGRVFLISGSRLYAYSPDGALAWDANLPLTLSGQTQMRVIGGALLITSHHGQVIVARDGGGFCGFTRFYGDDRAGLWLDLGQDGILRVQIGDQLAGLNWERFAGTCAG